MTLRPSPRTPQAVQCDVSVEEDNHQEWTFTLYGFDNSGKATREVMRPGSHPGDTAGSSRREERQGAFLGQAVGREPLQDRTQVTGRAGWSLIHSPGPDHCVPFLVEPSQPWLSLPWPAAPQQGSEGPRGAPGMPSLLPLCPGGQRAPQKDADVEDH